MSAFSKAKAEAGVLLVERWILAALRNRTFFSLAELNAAIKELLQRLNSRPFKKLPGSREDLFRELDKPALQALPAQRYEYAEWRELKASFDYHVALHLGERRFHYYSVPYQLSGERVRLRITSKTVEAYCKGRRIAAHVRDDTPGAATTQPEHMPSAHRRYAEWTPRRILNWAAQTGESCRSVAERILADRPHPEQGFRSCLGLIKLTKHYGRTRVEKACRRALALDLISYQNIKNMLDNNQDKLPLPVDEPLFLPKNDPQNIRGSAYYQ